MPQDEWRQAKIMKNLTKKTHRTTDRAIPASKSTVGRTGNSTQKMCGRQKFWVKIAAKKPCSNMLVCAAGDIDICHYGPGGELASNFLQREHVENI